MARKRGREGDGGRGCQQPATEKIQRAFHSQKSRLLPLVSVKGRQRRQMGGGDNYPSPPPTNPSETFYPAPSLGDIALRPAIRISTQPHCPQLRDPGVPTLGTQATSSSPLPHLQAVGFPQPFRRGRGGHSAPSPLFSMGWDFVNEQSRDTASFVRPPPPTTGEAGKEGRGPPKGLAEMGH